MRARDPTFRPAWCPSMRVVMIVRRLLIATVVLSFCNAYGDSRGVRVETEAVQTFDPSQSAALFVGVRLFPYDGTLAEVRYAVDDAIDLATVLALDEHVRLVEPSRVVLALSGEPQKSDSRRNLERLVAAGARIRSAGGPDILNVLDEQSRAAGKNGVLILAFATHGYTRDGTLYLLTATSILRHHEGEIAESEIRDIASQSDAARSLILVDACRERLTSDRRGHGPDARSAAPLLRAMESVYGQVVLSAAAAGQYAYDDDVRRNGVFTATLIDGLRCQAAADPRGLITADSLASFVEQHVLAWIRKYRDPGITHATQVSCEGSAKTMPLAQCRSSSGGSAAPATSITAPTKPTPSSPIRSIAVVAFSEKGEPIPHLIAAANSAIRESGYSAVPLVQSGAANAKALQQLAAGRPESLARTRLSGLCRAVFAGTVVRSATVENDPSLQGMVATHLHLRFYLLDTSTASILSSFDAEARGGGFFKESSEMQAWERAASILRTEMRKMKWAELLAAQ
jgi:uncharacterized caspase-like protein